MKKIRTILAYYNGEKFIDEQLQSIVNQEIPEGYEHEIYVYDDGSKDESARYLATKWKEKAKIITCKNSGVTFRFLDALADAKRDSVDYCFFADQDDFYLSTKYSDHICAHRENPDSKIVISRSVNWYPSEKDRTEQRVLNLWDGHRISLSLDAMNNFSLEAFRKEIEKLSTTKYSKKYHDFFVSILFTILSPNGIIFIDKVLTKYRIHLSSVTNKNNLSKEIIGIWKNNYDYYFKVMKPFFANVIGHNLRISEYNRAFIYFDYNFLKKNKRWLSIFRFYWNNFAMLIRFKWMRNM